MRVSRIHRSFVSLSTPVARQNAGSELDEVSESSEISSEMVTEPIENQVGIAFEQSAFSAGQPGFGLSCLVGGLGWPPRDVKKS